MLEHTTQLKRLIRPKDVPQYVGLRHTQIVKLRREGKFPQPIKLNDDGRAIAYIEDEVAAWQSDRLKAREDAAQRAAAVSATAESAKAGKRSQPPKKRHAA